MEYRNFGKTGWKVSEIGFGAWGIGADWGQVNESDALDALRVAIEAGMNFIDTADVYGDGRSEQLIAKVLKEYRGKKIYVATKTGRRLNPHTPQGYNREKLTSFIDRSLKNLDVEALDLVQLHCPPTQVFYMPEVFEVLDNLVRAGKLRHYGVSVEKVEEAIKALEFPGVKSVQIIYNIFRQRPAELFFELAKKKHIAILARVPLASGLLTGKMNRDSVFETDDHRNYNRHGESFDVGETFSGVDYETGLKAVEEIRALVPAGLSMAQFALRWILMNEAVTLAIPGAKNRHQADENAAASGATALSGEVIARIQQVYDIYIREQVHQRW
jgi:aryl-alcohol dehydrogenase-like predicted oxidoreductase